MEQVILYITPQPFGVRKMMRVPFVEGETFAAMLNRVCPHHKFNCFACDIDEPIKSGGVYHAWNVPEASAITAGAIAVGKYIAAHWVQMVVVAALSAVSYGVNYYMTKKQMSKLKMNYNKETEDLSDTNYGWDYDAQNAVTEGAPVPILYGERAIIPPILEQHVENDGDDQYLYLTYGVAEAGSGFNDFVDYAMNTEGVLQAWINHAFWMNYFNGESDDINLKEWMAPNSENGNTIPDVLYNADVSDINNVTGTMVDRSRDEFDVPMHYGVRWTYQQNIGKVYFELYTPVRVKDVYMYVESTFPNELKPSAGIIEAQLYGYDADNSVWIQLGQIGSRNSRRTRGYYVIALQQGAAIAQAYQKYYISDWQMQYSSGIDDFVYGDYKIINYIAVYGYKQDATVYTYAQLKAYNGKLGMPKLFFTDYTWGGLRISKELDDNDFIYQTSAGVYPDKLLLHFNFPYGLYGFDDNNELEEKTVNITIQYRSVASDGTKGNWVTMATSVTAASQSQYTATESISVNADYCYELNVYLDPMPEVGTGEAATCIWDSLEEGWNFNCEYPRTAFVTCRMLATQNLASQIPQFKVQVKRNVVNVWNSIAGEWQEKPANNPAWIAWDLLVHPYFDELDFSSPNETGALASSQMSHELLIYSDFKRWADFCEDEGITASMYYDGNFTVKKALEYICEIGRAAIVNRGSRIGVMVDKAADVVNGEIVVAYTFDNSNVVADSWKISYTSLKDLPHKVQISYYDKARRWERSVILAQDDEYGLSKQKNSKEITLYACDDVNVAKAFADYYLKQNLIRRAFEWVGDIGTLPLDVGDVVKLYDDYVVITSISQDDEFGRQFSGYEYVAERFE